MSLLQGLLGFGAGAAGAFAEQKKADIDAQRRANLARLSAKYKGEMAAQQQAAAEQRRREIFEMENPEEARKAAIIAGETSVAEALAPAEDPQLTTSMQTERQRIKYYEDLFGMSEEEAARFSRLGEQDRYRPIQGQENFYRDSVTEEFGRFVDNRFIPVDPNTGDFKIPEQYAGGAPSGNDRPPESLRETGRPPGRGLGVMSQQIMESPIPANVISQTPGMASSTKRLVTNFSFLGDLYSEYRDWYNSDQDNKGSGVKITPENEAKIIFNGYELKITEFFARDLQEEGRLQSMILELVQDMKPKAGLFSSETGVEDGLATIGKLMAPRIGSLEEDLDPSKQSFYRMGNEERENKRKRLSALNEIYEDTEAMLAGNVISNTLVKMPSGQNRPVSDLNLQEVTSLQNQFESNPNSLNTRQRTALSYWWGLYSRSLRSAGAR